MGHSLWGSSFAGVCTCFPGGQASLPQLLAREPEILEFRSKAVEELQHVLRNTSLQVPPPPAFSLPEPITPVKVSNKAESGKVAVFGVFNRLGELG